MQCRRKRLIQYHAAGAGIVPKGLDEALSFGTFIHALLSKALKEPSDFDLLSYAQEKRQEAQTLWQLGGLEKSQAPLMLASALAWVWHRQHLPVLLKQFEVVCVEEEWVLDLGEIQWPYRIDAVLRDRTSGELAPLDFKSVSYIKDDYLDAYNYDMQTTAHTWAVEQHFGEPCSRVLLHFLHKGINKLGVYYSPLVCGYWRNGAPPLTQRAYNHEWRSGWSRFDTWDFPEGGLEGWLRQLPESVLREQVITREIYRHSDTDAWIKQFEVQEHLVKDALLMLEQEKDEESRAALMRKYFPGNLDASCWRDKWGKKCPYTRLCFDKLSVEEALVSSEFVRREPHSLAERLEYAKVSL